MYSEIFTGGGNIVVGGYGMAGCEIGFPLNDDMPMIVHSNQMNESDEKKLGFCDYDAFRATGRLYLF